MKVSHEKLKAICEKKHINLKELLCKAGVSRNAYYSLERKNNILPKSIISIANHLKVQPSAFITEDNLLTQKTKSVISNFNEIIRSHKISDSDNVRHTLILLQEKPIERLRRSLTRGQKFNFHK